MTGETKIILHPKPPYDLNQDTQILEAVAPLKPCLIFNNILTRLKSGVSPLKENVFSCSIHPRFKNRWCS